MTAAAAFRFGRDAPSRIATSAVMFDEANELLPEEFMNLPVIPFYPVISSGSGSSSSTDEIDSWTSMPGRIDLTFYQGDDVTIPLIIEDPSDTTPDLSTAWDWTAQIRLLHSYHSTLVNTFSVVDEYFPPDADAVGFTQVTLFLPRSENVYWGSYRWDLYSKSPLDVATYPRPPDVIDPEPWPPTDQIRTWLYGAVTILPRVTTTDSLPIPVVVTTPGEVTGYVSGTGFFVGPNGRVP